MVLNGGLVKTTKFGKPNYIGDPMNAVRIFNDLKADELVFLDITPAKKRHINFELIQQIAEEAFMPFAYGGGVYSIETAGKILSSGAEKVVLNGIAYRNNQVLSEIAATYGNQSIIASIDVKKKRFGKQQVYISNGSKSTGLDPVEYAVQLQNKGAGEVLIQSVDHDGMMEGYDIELIKRVVDKTNIPIIACSGAGKLEDMREVIESGLSNAAAAGSLFVYQGNRKGILINYPDQKELIGIFT